MHRFFSVLLSGYNQFHNRPVSGKWYGPIYFTDTDHARLPPDAGDAAGYPRRR